MENPIIPEPKSAPTKPDLATNGMKMFIEASRVCPASVIAQSAHIASHCKITGENPEELSSALLDRPDLVNKIRRAAHKAHAKRGKTDITVALNNARMIIGQDFFYASEMLILEQDELERMYKDNYQKRQTWSPEKGDFEEWMFTEFQKLRLQRLTQFPPTS